MKQCKVAFVRYKGETIAVIQVAYTITSNIAEREYVLKTAKSFFRTEMVALYGRNVFMKDDYWAGNEEIEDYLRTRNLGDLSWKDCTF